ncbi:MAG: hypothetical protein HBSAPP02_27250 [Phycisphaerae bacterium]|nr:MAG: hypothetical protein HBSAPP02_27250 [Phycisphaerae bacterium]
MGWMPCFSQTSETGACSIKCSRKIAIFSAPVKFRRALDMENSYVECPNRCNPNGRVLQFRLKQDNFFIRKLLPPEAGLMTEI